MISTSGIYFGQMSGDKWICEPKVKQISITRSSDAPLHQTMDPRHPFSRQPAQPHSIAEDPRYPPIPPPPYSSQRQDLPPHNDPFFPRRQQYENHAASPTKAEQPSSYGLPPPPYPPNPFAATHNHNVNDGRARRDSYESSIIYDHFRGEENESRNGECTCIL